MGCKKSFQSREGYKKNLSGTRYTTEQCKDKQVEKTWHNSDITKEEQDIPLKWMRRLGENWSWRLLRGLQQH